MSSNNHHIIAQCRWETVTFRQEVALQLQEKLSDWTNTIMPREAQRVFDRLCMPEQVWKIDSLEIDLGEIESGDNIQYILTERFSSQLYEKLTGHSLWDAAGNSVAYEATSLNRMVELYFLYGLYPWDYSSTYGSINELLRKQLQKAFAQTISTIKGVAAHSETVRKRMAWQIDDGNLEKILSGLEPSNHQYILGFTNDLVQLQQQESIIQTPSADFKKSLWLAVLNFIFSERGSLFNRKMFVQSSLHQLADRYNIAYEELLEMIRKALMLHPLPVHQQPEFIYILDTLVKEENSAVNDLPQHQTKWELLLHYLQHPSRSETVYELSELLKELVNESDIILSAIIDEWIHADQLNTGTKTLDDQSFDILCTIICKEYSDFVVKAVDYFKSVSGAAGLKFDRKALLEDVFVFLKKDGRSINEDELLSFLISHIAKHNASTSGTILIQLALSDISYANVSLASAPIAQKISKLFKATFIQAAKPEFLEKVHTLMDTLYRSFNQGNASSQPVVFLQAQIKAFIQHRPGEFVSFLQTEQKTYSKGFWRLVLDKQMIAVLLENAQRFRHYQLWCAAMEVFQKSSNRLAINFSLLKDELSREGLLLLLWSEESTPVHFIKEMVAFISKKAGIPAIKIFHLLSEESKSQLLNKVLRSETDLSETKGDTFDWLLKQLETGSSKELPDAALVKSFVWHHQFPIFLTTDRAAALANKCMPNGWKWLERACKRIAPILISRGWVVYHKDFSLVLQRLAWMCLLQNNAYSRSEASCFELYKEAVFQYFSTHKANLRSSVHHSREHNDGMIAEKRDALGVLRKYLDHNTAVDEPAIQKSAHVILQRAFDTDPYSAAKILAGAFDNSNAGMASLSVQEICGYLSGTSARINAAVTEINNLYRFTCLISDNPPEELQNVFRESLLMAVRSDNWTKEDSAELLKVILKYVEVPVVKMVSIIRQKHFALTPLTASVMEAEFELDKNALPVQQLPQHQVLYNKGLLADVIRHLLMYHELPAWLETRESASSLLSRIIENYPYDLLKVCRKISLTDAQLEWLMDVVSFESFISNVAKATFRNRHLPDLLELPAILSVLPPHMRSQHILFFIHKRVFEACVKQEWSKISLSNILKMLMWHIATLHGVLHEEVIDLLSQHKKIFSASARLAIDTLTDERADTKMRPVVQAQKNENNKKSVKVEEILQQGIAVRNAGIVLLNSYLPLLFERMELINEGSFVTSFSKEYAVNSLQYLSTGFAAADEADLMLNKVMCGMDIISPLQVDIPILDEHKTLMDGLLGAAISHWPSGGSDTPDGFRGNWIIRNGVLRNSGEKWELTVDRKAYDLLLNHSPFSFSRIKYPWMDKVLEVKWKY